MSKSESNKGIYIFWGGIAAVIAIVVLVIIFLPRVNAASVYNNINDASVKIAQTDENGKDAAFFVTSFINDPETGANHKVNLNNLYALQQTMVASNDFSRSALLYVSPSKDFNALAGEQNAKWGEYRSALENFQAYCTGYVTPLFNGTVFTDRSHALNEMLPVFYGKYQDVIAKMADFYLLTAKLCHTSATLCYEINQTMLDKNLELMEKVQGFAAASALTTGEAAEVLNQSKIIYAEGYYKSFI